VQQKYKMNKRYNFITFFHFELYHWRGNLHLEIHFGWYAIQISHNLLILFSKPTPRVGFFSSATFLSCSHEVTVDALIRLPSLWSASLISGPPSLVSDPPPGSLIPPPWSLIRPSLVFDRPFWSLIPLSSLWSPFLVSDPPPWSLLPLPALWFPSSLILTHFVFIPDNPWLPDEINNGFLELFIFLLAIILFLNFVVFVLLARAYTYTRLGAKKPTASTDSPFSRSASPNQNGTSAPQRSSSFVNHVYTDKWCWWIHYCTLLSWNVLVRIKLVRIWLACTVCLILNWVRWLYATIVIKFF